MGLRRWTCLLLLAVLPVGDSLAGPRETHKLGVEAIKAGRWADAERFFRAAITERSQERFNRVLKSAYLPHYYLGVALAESGNCKAALDSWAESSRQAQIAKSDFKADLDRRRNGCQDLLRRIDATRSEVEQLLVRVDEASTSLSSLSRMPELAPLWSQGSPSFDSRQKSAEKKLIDARGRFADLPLGGELKQLDQAKGLANSALAELNSTLTDARGRLGELNAATAEALEQLEEVEESARRSLRSISDLKPYPQRLGLRAAAVERTLKTVRESKSGSSPQQLAELTDDLKVALTALRRAARRPPKELTRALEAFLNGSYTDTLTLLEDPGLTTNDRTRPHVCLIRAATQHALWVLSGEQDDSLHALATQAITACDGNEPAAEPDQTPSEPSLIPNEKFFSPRFVEFHNATLIAQAAELEVAEGAGADGNEADPMVEDLEPGNAPASAVPQTDDSSNPESGIGSSPN